MESAFMKTKCIAFVILSFVLFGFSVEKAAADWKADWEKNVAAAEKEGQVTVYGPPSIEYQNAIGAFQNAYPKIKLVYVPGSGSSNSQRLLAERRADRYLGDLFVGGSGTFVLVLFNGGMLDPITPAIVLPENTDQSLWFGKKHLYADSKGQYVFMMQGNINTALAAYNTKLFKPDGIKSYWDVLNPKWKGKLVAYDPKARGHIQTIRSVYYNPKLGGEFIRKLLSEMDVTVSRDQRQMIDWLAQGKFLLYLFPTRNDIDDAKKKGLPVDVIDAPDDESYMSGGFGHVGLVNNAPHPNAAKVLVNWLLSKQGQIKWQERTDNNSLRTDVPKGMLSDSQAIPKEGGRYLIASLPQYEEVGPIMKIVDEALAKAGKK
jgi:iron(III) transport system substrate-binding protein